MFKLNHTRTHDFPFSVTQSLRKIEILIPGEKTDRSINRAADRGRKWREKERESRQNRQNGGKAERVK